jgi:uncharacterized membrane protein (DUF485 family)
MSDQPLGRAGDERPAPIDWRTAGRSPEFQRLVRTRNRFVYPATAFFLIWYVGFILLAGYAPDFMGESVYEGLTVGYVLALSQFVMTWGLAGWYLRKSNRKFDPLAEEARSVALDAAAHSHNGHDGARTQHGAEVQR